MSLPLPTPRSDDAGWANPPHTIAAPPEARVVATATTLAPGADDSVRIAVHRSAGFPRSMEWQGVSVRFDAPTKCVTPLAALCDHCRALVLHEDPEPA